MIAAIKFLYAVTTGAAVGAISFVDGVNHGYHKNDASWTCRICKHSSVARRINLYRTATRTKS